MNCKYCGSELKEGANFCTICGMPVPEEQKAATEEQNTVPSEQRPIEILTIPDQPAPEKDAASEEAPEPANPALKGYKTYTSGEYRTQPQPRTEPLRSQPSASSSPEGDGNYDWAAWVGIVCAVLALKGIVITIPGVILGAAAVILGIIGLRSKMRVLSIFSIVFGAIALLGALGMAAVWRWIFGLASSYDFHPEFYW